MTSVPPSQANGFRKQVPEPCPRVSIREAVSKWGDDWVWFGPKELSFAKIGEQHRGDYRDYLMMVCYERGKIPRIREDEIEDGARLAKEQRESSAVRVGENDSARDQTRMAITFAHHAIGGLNPPPTDDSHQSIERAGAGGIVNTKHMPATLLPWKVGLRQSIRSEDTTNDYLGAKISVGDSPYVVHAANAYPKLIKALHAMQCACSIRERYSGHRTDCARADIDALLRELGEAL